MFYKQTMQIKDLAQNPSAPAMFYHEPQEIRASHACGEANVSYPSPGVTQGVAQAMSQAASRPRTRRWPGRRSPGPYLEIRGRTYYYRRRLCAPWPQSAERRSCVCPFERTSLGKR
jgi:hypothetical protein